ncbi:replication initiation protein RepC [Rhizobium sp. PP-F2F-G36]|nr:replication initiation protein RepC [Rhizobium sp. PP-F2F-G36]
MPTKNDPDEPQAQRRVFPGARRVTPDSLSAQRATRNYAAERTLHITRTQALQVAKRAAAAIGLGSAKIALLDVLFGFSKASDWSNPTSNPIIWPSNTVLAFRLGVSVSTMRHHLRGLIGSGIIATSSHPTFQRRGVRGADGNIVVAYGIDLSPLITRYGEFLEIAEAAEFEAAERRRLSYRRTQVRREIEAVLDSASFFKLDGPWPDIRARLDAIRERRCSDSEAISAQIVDLEELRDEAEEAFELAFDTQELDAEVTKYRHVQTTGDLQNLNPCKIERTSAHAEVKLLHRIASGEGAFEKKPASVAPVEQDLKVTSGDDVRNISLPLVRDACPAIAESLPDAVQSWSNLINSGRALCVLSGINPQVWQEACSTLGQHVAIAAVAVTFQRHSAGVVANPGGYLRALVQRGREEELFISRSLFALANAEFAGMRRTLLS